MTTVFTRGRKAPLSATELHLSVLIDAPETWDIFCLGLDAEDRYVDPNTTLNGGPITTLGPMADAGAVFGVTLDNVPAPVHRVVFCAAVTGRTTASSVRTGHARITAGGVEVMRYPFSGADFGSERAIVIADIYRRNGWRMSAVGQGFAGGREELLRAFGAEAFGSVASPAPPPPMSSPPAPPPRPPAPPVHSGPPVRSGPPPGFGGLLGHVPTDSAEPFSLQNGKMLKAILSQESGMREFFALAGAMVAFQGGVNFDGDHQRWARHVIGAMTGVWLPLMRVSGAGTVYLANQAQDVHILRLARDGLTVSGHALLAFQRGLDWNIVRLDTGGPAIASTGTYTIEITGIGMVAVTTNGAPLVMRVTPQNYYFADADAVIAWSSSLQVSMQAAVTTSAVWTPRGNTGEGWQMQFSGEGFVVVQPFELAPHYRGPGQRIPGRYGVGPGGFKR